MAEQVFATFTTTNAGVPFVAPPSEAKPPDPLFIGLDDPVEMPHQDPYEAAKRIRELARQLVDQTSSTGGSSKIKTQVKYVREALVSCIYYDDDHTYYVSNLRTSFKTRRVSSIEQELERLQKNHTNMRQKLGLARERVRKLELMLQKEGVPSSSKVTAEEIHKLAQSLPTISTAPVMPIDQTLRAIATLLKNGGYFNEKGQPVKPGDVLKPDYAEGPDDEDSYEDEE